MSGNRVATSKIIILNKLSYHETSLIATALSPDFGKLDFLIKGEKKLTKKHFPSIDLFREFSVKFIYKSSGLNTISDLDLVHNFDKIALYSKVFQAACKISRFIINNSFPDIKCPLLYYSLRNFLDKSSAEGKEFIFPEAVIRTVYLYEHGLMPEDLQNFKTEKKSARQKFIRDIIEYGLDSGKTLPTIQIDYWKKYCEWINNLCILNHLKI